MFARSVGHTDPVYYDEAAAKAAGYRGLVAPPGYLGTPVFRPSAGGDAGPMGRNRGPQPRRPLNRVLNGGTEIEYLDDICAGDMLTARPTSRPSKSAPAASARCSSARTRRSTRTRTARSWPSRPAPAFGTKEEDDHGRKMG